MDAIAVSFSEKKTRKERLMESKDLHMIWLLVWILALVKPAVQQTISPLPLSWKKFDPAVPEKSGYSCYVRCLAKCVMEEGKARRASALDTVCVQKCRSYNRDDLCTPSDTACWSKCRDLFQPPAARNVMPAVPGNVTVSYTLLPQPTPHEADLTWHSVADANLYVVKYVDVNEDGKTGTNLKVTTGIHFRFVKPTLCSMYAFAVAAVSLRGVSRFSESVILNVPQPVIQTPSYNFISAERINEPFAANPDDEYSKQFNSTVVVLVGFSPPPNWNLSSEITRIDANVHILDAGTPRLSFSTEPKQVPKLARFEIRLPGAVADTFAYCKFMFTVEKVFTKCDDQNAMYYPSYVYNPALNQTMPGLSVQLNCRDIKNSGCEYNPTAILPSCGYKDVTTEIVHEDGSDTADVEISFVPRHDPYGERPVLWYNVTYGEGQKELNTSESILFNMTKAISSRQLENSTYNFTLSNLDVGKVYVFYICSVYDLRARNIQGDWNELQRYAVDLTSYEKGASKADSSNSELRLVMVIAPLLVATLVASIVVSLYVTRKCRKNKVMGEHGAEHRDDDDGRYVTLKKRYDLWEIPRRRLQIDETQKLGSGAFGAVYKGRIVGTLVKNRDSKSVLAECWMRAENCDVAVKMLPAYADEVSKSEFQSEINLMKQLGYHERLVNMLACITADDPLCLIVEYCADGDLLNFLRKRRKYMVDLQEKGIDINNITDNSDIDFNMVLCKKDLISFAWQISVGLEYLSEHGYIHRDVAARNVLVATGKRAKIGDFGLCRYSCSDPVYTSKGGRLPIKWMALEAIRNYEYTTKSDVWSYGVLLFEIVTLGGSPYPGIQPHEMEVFLESGQRMEQPESCPYELYEVMLDCWRAEPEKRPTFTRLREGMRLMLEHITEDYYYMGLSQARDYYNAAYQRDEFADPSPSAAEPVQATSNADAAQSVPPSPTDTISFDDSGDNSSTLENNVFDAPPSPPIDPTPSEDRSSGAGTAEESSNPQPTQRSGPVPPPLPPRLRRLTSVGSESVASTDESFCASPAFMAIRRLDSTSSDQALLSPAFFGEKPGSFPKFFKFTPSTKLTPLPELTPISVTPASSEELKGAKVLDQLVECEVTPPTSAPATPVSPDNYLQSLLSSTKK